MKAYLLQLTPHLRNYPRHTSLKHGSCSLLLYRYLVLDMHTSTYCTGQPHIGYNSNQKAYNTCRWSWGRGVHTCTIIVTIEVHYVIPSLLYIIIAIQQRRHIDGKTLMGTCDKTIRYNCTQHIYCISSKSYCGQILFQGPVQRDNIQGWTGMHTHTCTQLQY